MTMWLFGGILETSAGGLEMIRRTDLYRMDPFESDLASCSIVAPFA